MNVETHVTKTPARATSTALRFSGPLSHSGLSQFKECPHHFRLERIEKIPTPQEEAPFTGHLAHKVIARYLRYLVNSKQTSDLDKLEEVLAPVELELPARMNAGFLRDTIHRFAGGFLLEPEEGEEVLIEEEVAVDRQFRPVPFNSPNAFFRGVGDLIYLNRAKKTARIIDFKTGYSMAHDDDQVERYALLLHRIFGVERADVGFHFVRHGRSTGLVTLGLDDFRATARKILQEAKRVDDERSFPASPGPWCSNCPFAGTQRCPVNLAAVEPIKRSDDAIRVIGEIERITGALKRLKSIAGEWCAINGPIQVGKVEWGHHPQKSSKVSVSKLAKVIAPEANIDESLCSALSLRQTRDAKRLLDRYMEPLAKAGAITHETKTTFSRIRIDAPESEECGE